MKKTRKNKNKSYHEVPLSKTSDELLFDGISDDRSKRKILILCEGPTEVNYFQGIIKSNLYGTNCKFVLPTQTQYNSAMQILLTATQILKFCYVHDEEKSKKLDDFLNKNKQDWQLENDDKLKDRLLKIDSAVFQTPFEEVWLVFDADDRLNSIVFEKAKEIGFYIAFSNRQWENWILLHFEQTLHTANESDCKKGCKILCHLETDKTQNCLIGYLKGKGYHPNYTKGGVWTNQKDRSHNNCFEGLLPANSNFQKPLSLAAEKFAFDKIKTAIKNSLWLYEQQNFPKPEKSTNPYTDVAILVALLMKEDFEWINYEVTTYKGIIRHQDFTMELLSISTTTATVQILITNLSANSLIMNVNQLENFNLIEESSNQNTLIKVIDITPTKIIAPKQSEIFKLSFGYGFSKFVKLRYKLDNQIFILSL